MANLIEYDVLVEEAKRAIHNLKNAADRQATQLAAAQAVIDGAGGIASALDTVGNDARVTEVIAARAVVAGDADRRAELVAKIDAAIAARQSVIDELQAEPAGDAEIEALQTLITRFLAISETIKTNLSS